MVGQRRLGQHSWQALSSLLKKHLCLVAKLIKSPVETPPYLKQVRLRDFRSVRDAKADFKPGINIIIGKNGSGKTNFVTLANNLVELYSEHNEGAGCEVTIGGHFEVKAIFNKSKTVVGEIDDSGRVLNDETTSVLAN